MSRAAMTSAGGPRCQRGQSLLEFVIVVPAFLFLVLAYFIYLQMKQQGIL